MDTVVVFDFFGVFCSSIATDWFKKHVSATPEALQAFQALCTQSDYGRLSRVEFNKAVSHLSGVAIPEIVAGIEAETHINRPLVAYVQKLHSKGYRIACLSNGTREWTLRVITDHGLGDLFEVVVLSGDMGIVKPSPEIYLHTLRLLGVDASQTIFVDDRQANVDAAVACGMQGMLFTDTSSFVREFEQLIAAA